MDEDKETLISDLKQLVNSTSEFRRSLIRPQTVRGGIMAGAIGLILCNRYTEFTVRKRCLRGKSGEVNRNKDEVEKGEE